jgi:hypothetical protein
MKKSKFVDVLLQAALFALPAILITISFYDTGRL